MQVLLRIANGKSNVRKVRIQSDTVIGRSPDCQLKVASNQISRRHCQIVIRDTVVAIKDLGSANGTFVNGRQVPPEVEIPLTPGTRVMLGPLQFTVEYDLPGMPAAAASAPVAAVAAGSTVAEAPKAQVAVVESQYQPQVHVDTLQAVPPDGKTPVPYVVVPPQQIPPQYAPPAVAPAAVAVAVAAPLAPVNHVAIPPAPVPAAVAVPAPVVAVASPVVEPPAATVMMASPFAQPPAAPEFFLPGAEATVDSEQEDTGGFNFGIFAASGSDVVVESAAEIPLMSEPSLSEPSKPESAKPAKKGLLQMFGWGKKKNATPEPEPAPAPELVADSEATIAFAAPPMEEVAAGAGLSFEMPVAEDAAVADSSSSDESLQNFFDNFK